MPFDDGNGILHDAIVTHYAAITHSHPTLRVTGEASIIGIVKHLRLKTGEGDVGRLPVLIEPAVALCLHTPRELWVCFRVRREMFLDFRPRGGVH